MKKLFKNLFRVSKYDNLKVRADSRELWREINPDKSEEVDIFLSILDEAFFIPKKYQFRVEPKDKLGDLYQMSRGFIDSFEIEIMLDLIFEKFTYELLEEELFYDLTFEEIFFKVTKSQIQR